jgi:hypothetical protein
MSTSRWKTVLSLGGSLAFAALALLELEHPVLFNIGKYRFGLVLFAVVFFALCAAVFLWLLFRPQRLLLDDDGFTLLGAFVAKEVLLVRYRRVLHLPTPYGRQGDRVQLQTRRARSLTNG